MFVCLVWVWVVLCYCLFCCVCFVMGLVWHDGGLLCGCFGLNGVLLVLMGLFGFGVGWGGFFVIGFNYMLLSL